MSVKKAVPTPTTVEIDIAIANIMEDDIGRDYEHQSDNDLVALSSLEPVRSSSSTHKDLEQAESVDLVDFESVEKAAPYSCSVTVNRETVQPIATLTVEQTSEFKCEKCEKSYKQLKSFNVHKCITKYQKVKCQFCSKEISQTNFSKHIKFHTQAKFPCNLCSKIFPNQTKLDKHLQRHEDLRCKECEKSFSATFFLKRHMKIHTRQNSDGAEHSLELETSQPQNNNGKAGGISNEAKHCKYCKVQFRNIKELTKHMRAEHGDKSSKCDICDKMFFSLKGLNDHRKLHISQVPASPESTSQGVNPGEQIFYVQETPENPGQVIISSDIHLGDMEGAEFVFV